MTRDELLGLREMARDPALIVEGCIVTPSDKVRWICLAEGQERVQLEGEFTLDELEAIVAFMRDPGVRPIGIAPV